MIRGRRSKLIAARPCVFVFAVSAKRPILKSTAILGSLLRASANGGQPRPCVKTGGGHLDRRRAANQLPNNFERGFAMSPPRKQDFHDDGDAAFGNPARPLRNTIAP